LRIHAPRAGEDLNSQQLESAPLRPIRILVVDDAPINRELIVALLSPLGAHFEEAGDGVQALEAAVRRTFDLILMDIQMPVLDGIAAAAAIRSSDGPNRETPIVAVSASVQPRDVEACRAAGMNDHVAKPLNIQDLTEKVLRWTLEAATPLAEPVVQAAGR
jgi:CheY-like chemotaxis protein